MRHHMSRTNAVLAVLLILAVARILVVGKPTPGPGKGQSSAKWIAEQLDDLSVHSFGIESNFNTVDHVQRLAGLPGFTDEERRRMVRQTAELRLRLREARTVAEKLAEQTKAPAAP